MQVFWRFTITKSFLYKYASVKAQNEAMKDILKGPNFFADNIDMKEIFKKIAPLNQQEKPKPIDIKMYKDFDNNPILKWPVLMKIIKPLTLNGHLIPKYFFNKRGIILNKTEYRIGAYFGRKQVLLYNSKTKDGFLLKHNKKKFFSLWVDAMKLSLTMLKKHKSLREEYMSQYNYLTSKEYWEKQFFKDKK
jgi:hypothetical protein